MGIPLTRTRPHAHVQEGSVATFSTPIRHIYGAMNVSHGKFRNCLADRLRQLFFDSALASATVVAVQPSCSLYILVRYLIVLDLHSIFSTLLSPCVQNTLKTYHALSFLF